MYKITILALTLIVVFLQAVQLTNASEIKGSSDGFTYQVRTIPVTPSIKQETLYIIELKVKGKPVNDAVINFNANMMHTTQKAKEEKQVDGHTDHGHTDNLGTGEAVPIKTKFTFINNGRYETQAKYSMKGKWRVFIDIEGSVHKNPIAIYQMENVTDEYSRDWIVYGTIFAIISSIGTIYANKNRTKASSINDEKRLTCVDFPDQQY